GTARAWGGLLESTTRERTGKNTGAGWAFRALLRRSVLSRRWNGDGGSPGTAGRGGGFSARTNLLRTTDGQRGLHRDGAAVGGKIRRHVRSVSIHRLPFGQLCFDGAPSLRGTLQRPTSMGEFARAGVRTGGIP